MVKLTGPGLAQSASGTLGGELTFSNWKGKAYLKQHRKPKQPRTGGQVGMRSIMRFLSQQWSAIAPVDQATWADLAAADAISPFNAYLKQNLHRWRNFQRPSHAWPATQAGGLGVDANHGISGSVRSIIVWYQITSLADFWAMQVHEVTAHGEPITWNNLRHLEPITGTGWTNFTLSPFDAGTHYLAFNPFTDQGNPSGVTVHKNTVVT